MENMKSKQKKAKGKGESKEEGGRRTNSSAKVFKNLQTIVADDYKRKDDKKNAKITGKRQHADAT